MDIQWFVTKFNLTWLWDRLSFTAALIIGALLFAGKLTKRKKYWLRFIVSGAVWMLFLVGYEYLNKYFGSEIASLPFGRVYLYLVQYFMSVVLILVLYDCNVWTALFCTTGGYCIQHVPQRIQMMLRWDLLASATYWQLALVLAILTVAEYIGVFLWIGKKRNCIEEIVVDNKGQIILSLFAVTVMILFNNRVMGAIDVTRVPEAKYLFTAICLVGVICILLLQVNLISLKRVESDNAKLQRILRESKDRYEYEKSLIDAINVKAHDLKHFSTANQDAELGEIVSAYDETFDTGNKALDVIFTRKAYACRQKGIKFTCMADGNKLAFMSDVDIYSLFGNLLDNAIESAEKLDEPDKKVIKVNVFAHDYLVTVRVTNYYKGKLAVNNNVIKTTKADKFNHGFGMRSINMIGNKYNGHVSINTDGEIFTVDIMFPV